MSKIPYERYDDVAALERYEAMKREYTIELKRRALALEQAFNLGRISAPKKPAKGRTE